MITIKLQPKQAMFYMMYRESKASWLGYGGSRGGAKSGALRRIMLKRRMDYPKTNGLILRRVWDDVQKNHVNKFWEEFPELREFYKPSEKGIFLPERLGSGIIFFDSAEHKADVERKAYGPEFMDVMVDQAEQFDESELTQIKTICRWPGMSEHACKYGLLFNPGGVGAAFLQRIFYTHKYEAREKPDDYAFLQAFGWDNVEWCRSALGVDNLTETDFYSWPPEKRFEYYITRAQYGQEMNALPPHKRPGQLLGDFKKFAGQYFSIFNEEVHVIPAEEIDFKPWWPRWMSVDWGFQHHAVAQWHCQAGEWVEDGQKKKLVITYRECVRQGLSEGALAEEFVAANNGDKLQAIYGGHDLWRKDTRGSKEKKMSEIFRRAGLPQMRQAKIDRVDGWRMMYTMLDECEWIITRDCPELAMSIPTAVFNEKADGGMGNEDVLKTNTKADDCLDTARYGLYTQYGPKRKSESEQDAENTSHLDPTSRSIQLNKIKTVRERKLASAGQVLNHSIGRYSRMGRRVS